MSKIKAFIRDAGFMMLVIPASVMVLPLSALIALMDQPKSWAEFKRNFALIMDMGGRKDKSYD